MGNVDLDEMKYSDMVGGNLKGEDLKDEGPLDVTVADIDSEVFEDKDKGTKESKFVFSFQEDKRRLVMNLTRLNAMKDCFGSRPKDWIGKRVRLSHYKVQFGAKMVDAIRLDGLSEFDEEPASTTAPAASVQVATNDDLNKLVDAAKRVYGDEGYKEQIAVITKGRSVRELSRDEVYKALDALDRAKPPVPAGAVDDDPFSDL